MQIPKYVNLSLLFLIKQMKTSISSWSRLYGRLKTITNEDEFVKGMFDQYLQIIKPRIYHNSMLKELQYRPDIRLYTDDINEQQLKRLINVFQPLKYLPTQIGPPPKDSLILNSLSQIQSSGARRELLYRMKVQDLPTNKQLEYWRTTLPVEPLVIKSRVIHGKGIGQKDLGMPTANLENTPEIDLMLVEYPSAVYVVTFKMRGVQYKGAMNIGTNPQISDSEERKLEVYVCHKFEEDFYEEIVEVKILRIIRFELKFPSFDCFLNSMHNDIEVARSI